MLTVTNVKAEQAFDIVGRYLPSIDRSRSREHVTSVLEMAKQLDSNLVPGIDISGNPSCNQQNQIILVSFDDSLIMTHY